MIMMIMFKSESFKFLFVSDFQLLFDLRSLPYLICCVPYVGRLWSGRHSSIR